MQAPQFQFNANQYEPNQGLGIHPPAQKIPFTITGTSIVETKDKTGAMLVVEFTSPIGMLINRYNIHNTNPKTVEIAFGQLSALCRAVGIYQIDGANECAGLRGGKGLMDVGYQKGESPAENPDAKGYTELKRVYDAAGNDPSKPAQAQTSGFAAPATAGSQPQSGQPMTQQPGGGWGTPAPQGNPAQQQPQAQQPASQQGQAWQPNAAPQATTPPWGSR